jgi:hypothetical protein
MHSTYGFSYNYVREFGFILLLPLTCEDGPDRLYRNVGDKLRIEAMENTRRSNNSTTRRAELQITLRTFVLNILNIRLLHHHWNGGVKFFKCAPVIYTSVCF